MSLKPYIQQMLTAWGDRCDVNPLPKLTEPQKAMLVYSIEGFIQTYLEQALALRLKEYDKLDVSNPYNKLVVQSVRNELDFLREAFK